MRDHPLKGVNAKDRKDSEKASRVKLAGRVESFMRRSAKNPANF